MNRSRSRPHIKAGQATLAPLQKKMGQPVHHLPYKRFKGYREANSGMDPMGNWTNFLKHDLVPNIDVHRDTREIQDMSTYNSARWAVGTQKFTATKVDLGGSLPRPNI